MITTPIFRKKYFGNQPPARRAKLRPGSILDVSIDDVRTIAAVGPTSPTAFIRIRPSLTSARSSQISSIVAESANWGHRILSPFGNNQRGAANALSVDTDASAGPFSR